MPSPEELGNENKLLMEKEEPSAQPRRGKFGDENEGES